MDPIANTLETAAKSEVASLSARVKALETAGESWFAKNWPHLISWIGIAWGVLRHL